MSHSTILSDKIDLKPKSKTQISKYMLIIDVLFITISTMHMWIFASLDGKLVSSQDLSGVQLLAMVFVVLLGWPSIILLFYFSFFATKIIDKDKNNCLLANGFAYIILKLVYFATVGILFFLTARDWIHWIVVAITILLAIVMLFLGVAVMFKKSLSKNQRLYIDNKKRYHKKHFKLLSKFDLDNPKILQKVLALKILILTQFLVGFNIEKVINSAPSSNTMLVSTSIVNIGVASSIVVFTIAVASFIVLYMLLVKSCLNKKEKSLIMLSNILSSICLLLFHNFVDELMLWMYQIILFSIFASFYYSIIHNLNFYVVELKKRFDEKMI